MGYIREPKGVDLLIGPSVLTAQDRKIISEIIADYKRTGKLPSKTQKADLRKQTTSPLNGKTARKRVLA